MLVLLLAAAASACAPGGSTTPAERGAPATDASPEPGIARWLPQPGSTWQWQLSGDVDVTVEAGIFDVDFETTTPEEIDALKQDG